MSPLTQQKSSMARVRTWTVWSKIEHLNHESTSPPHLYCYNTINLFVVFEGCTWQYSSKQNSCRQASHSESHIFSSKSTGRLRHPCWFYVEITFTYMQGYSPDHIKHNRNKRKLNIAILLGARKKLSKPHMQWRNLLCLLNISVQSKEDNHVKMSM